MTPNRLAEVLPELFPNTDGMLIYETALVAFMLDGNFFPYAFDVLGRSRLLDAVSSDNDFERRLIGDDFAYVLKGDGAPVRVWETFSGGLSAGDATCHRNGIVGWDVLDSEEVLETLPSMPEARYLLEERARLALVLHYEDMTDEELLEFRRYVRFI